MSSGVLPVSTITPPTLKSIRGDPIVKFNTEYERYLRQIEELNASLVVGKKVKPVGLKACITGELLLALIDLNAFKDISSPLQVKDAHIKEWLSARTKCAVADIPGQVKEALSRVKYRTDRKDPEVRDAVQSSYDYWTKDEQESFAHFHEFVIKTAVECAKYTKKPKEEKKGKDDNKHEDSSSSKKDGNGATNIIPCTNVR